LLRGAAVASVATAVNEDALPVSLVSTHILGHETANE
jgi:hypothetical protein